MSMSNADDLVGTRIPEAEHNVFWSTRGQQPGLPDLVKSRAGRAVGGLRLRGGRSVVPGRAPLGRPRVLKPRPAWRGVRAGSAGPAPGETAAQRPVPARRHQDGRIAAVAWSGHRYSAIRWVRPVATPRAGMRVQAPSPSPGTVIRAPCALPACVRGLACDGDALSRSASTLLNEAAAPFLDPGPW